MVLATEVAKTGGVIGAYPLVSRYLHFMAREAMQNVRTALRGLLLPSLCGNDKVDPLSYLCTEGFS